MTDYISREAAVKAVAKHAQEMRETKGVGLATMQLYQLGFKHAIDVLDTLPAADDVPVVRGEWIKCGRDRRPLCSKCGYEPLEITREYIVDGKPHSWDCAYNLANFCPNCGADMRKEAKDE